MIYIIILFLSLVSASQLTSLNSEPKLKSDPSAELVYDLGLYDPNGMLGINKVTVKGLKGKAYEIYCDQTSIYIGRPLVKLFRVKYVAFLLNCIKSPVKDRTEKDPIVISLKGSWVSFQFKVFAGIKVNHTSGTGNKSHFIEKDGSLRVQAKVGDGFQIIDPYGLTGAVVGFTLGKVKALVLIGKYLNYLNHKFEVITEYELSNEKPTVEEIIAKDSNSEEISLQSLTGANYRFKWFADEKKGSILPKVNHSDFTMEFTESALIILNKFNNSKTIIRLVGEDFQIEIDENSPFLVLIASKEVIHKRKKIPRKYQTITKTKPFIKISKDDEIIVFNFHQDLLDLIPGRRFPKTREELIEHLQMHSLVDNIYISAQVIQNTIISEIQETESTNNTNSTKNTNKFQNNKKHEQKPKPSQKYDPKPQNKPISKGSKKELSKEKNLELDTGEKTRPLKTVLPFQNQIKEPTIAELKDQDIKIENNNYENDSVKEPLDHLERAELFQPLEGELKMLPLETLMPIDLLSKDQINEQNILEPKDLLFEIENSTHETNSVDDELSDCLEKISLLQPPKYKLKKSLSANNIRETAAFYILPKASILKQTNLKELD